MRISILLMTSLFCSSIAAAAFANNDADDVTILSVKPRDSQIRPIIILRSGQPAQNDALRVDQPNKTSEEALRLLPDNRALEKAKPLPSGISL